MAVQRRSTGTRRKTEPKAAPRRGARKQAVTDYATKAPTGYHKAFAKWIVEEIGYDPENAPSLRAAFLRGVSIATAARAAFQQSDAVDEYRERSGEAKRGPRPAARAAQAAAPAARRRKPEPEPEEEEEEEEEEDWEDETEEAEEEDEFDSEEESEETADDDDWEDEEEKPTPAPKRRAAPAKAAPARKTAPAKPAAKAAPAKATRRPAKPASDDDDFIF
ncbi:MAG TPA: hypothetical protein VMP68_31315 [Candidatus Eisenbacteria bacterium]|nr:hypothetical protein [Candidatus Eisenbacteria bacterium]